MESIKKIKEIYSKSKEKIKSLLPDFQQKLKEEIYKHIKPENNILNFTEATKIDYYYFSFISDGDYHNQFHSIDFSPSNKILLLGTKYDYYINDIIDLSVEEVYRFIEFAEGLVNKIKEIHSPNSTTEKSEIKEQGRGYCAPCVLSNQTRELQCWLDYDGEIIISPNLYPIYKDLSSKSVKEAIENIEYELSFDDDKLSAIYRLLYDKGCINKRPTDIHQLYNLGYSIGFVKVKLEVCKDD